jgi:protocatechuate 3,4-dioxygenase beta subunit
VRSTLVLAFALAAIVALSSIARAQTIGGGGTQAGAQAATRAATAVIRGRVIAADTGRPLRRAQVTLTSADENGVRRAISTSAEGRYEFADLPAGRYTIAAWRAGYLTLRHGQRRPLEAGTPLQILDGQIVEEIDFTLPRMGVLAGRVTDEAGQPIAGARVLVMRQAYIDGDRRLGAVDYGTTDDAGQYRIVNLAPGAYFVFATLWQTWTIIERDVEQTIGYAPTYFPGTPALQNARRIALGAGQTVDTADFSMVRAPVASVSGTAIDSRGRPLAGETISLSQAFPNGGTNAAFQYGGTLVEADGTFTIRNVPPGDYKLVMRYVVRDGSGAHVEEAGTARLSVGGVAVRDVRFVTSRGGTVAGQLLTDQGTVPAILRDRVKIVGRPLAEDADLKVGGIDDSGDVQDDGTFYVGGLFGRTRIRAILPEGWMLKAVQRDGRDITDEWVDLGSRERIPGIQVIVSDRVTAVTGRVIDQKNVTVSDGTVVIFHREQEKWIDESRYLRAVRPDERGQFEIRGLPPGDYLAAAVGYVEEGGWNDPSFLESIRRSAQPLSLAEGATAAISLRLISP